MKKLLIVPIVALAMCGCYKTVEDSSIDDPWTRHGDTCRTKVVNIEGHKYVLLHDYHSGCIVHAASCDCQAK